MLLADIEWALAGRTGFVTAVAWPLMLTRCMSWPPTRMRRRQLMG